MNLDTFLLQAFVYLVSVVCIVPIAKRLGLGSVLGYLLAGVLIGPFVLGFIQNEGQELMHMAEFGVVMMLFLIGLELEPQMLWKLRKVIVGMGSLQVIFSALIIGAVAVVLGFNWQQSLALGLIFSLSSTAMAMQSLQEKGLMKTAAGQRSFAVLLFQDIAVIPMLAIFPLLANLEKTTNAANAHNAATLVDGQPAWIHTLVVLGSVAAIIIAGRLGIRPLLRVVAKTRIRELFTASALLIVVGIALLMTMVGLSPALGTFLAGVVLANSEYRHELQSDIEPFKGLLLGLFFIAVGASIDFSLLVGQPWTVLGWVLLLLVGKSALLFFLGKSFRLSTGQNLIFAFGLSQVGEFAFVLFSFALQEGILPASVVSLMIAVVAISMALTPLVMLLNEKVFLPRVHTADRRDREADTINEKNAVIVAGFGHFGNTVGRFLRANGVGATFLDLDSDTVDVLRKMGLKVFYGDASRLDLLEAAGAAEAKIIIIAIDSKEKRLEMIETIKKHFPNLHILVRAANRYDAYDLMNAGMLHVYRESVDTSVRMGVEALNLLGYRAYTANRMAKKFLKHDERHLKKLAAIRNEEEYISEARKYMEEIEFLIRADREAVYLAQDAGWDAETLREEAKART